MPAALRLPLTLDADAMASDLDRLPSSAWISHFNQAIYEGDWSGLPLRGPADATHPIQQLHPSPSTTEWSETAFLAASPGFVAGLSRFRCPLLSARLLRLGPGARIRPHRDHAMSWDDGEVRLHIPIRTNPEVDFRVAEQRVEMRAGEVWFIDASQRHTVHNGGRTPRVHLVVDVVVDDWLRHQASVSVRHSGPTM